MIPEFETTPSAVLAAVTRHLTTDHAGYRVSEVGAGAWPSSYVRVFEDPLAIAAVVVFDTWEELKLRWREAQGALVELITSRVPADEPKAWDGYLVLLALGGAAVEPDALDAIRYDVTQVRKLVAAGYELATIGDVERVLAPLLPLAADLHLEGAPPGALEALEGDLSRRGVDAASVRCVIDAFERQDSLLESLHRLRGGA
jgi:hypothetical protein